MMFDENNIYLFRTLWQKQVHSHKFNQQLYAAALNQMRVDSPDTPFLRYGAPSHAQVLFELKGKSTQFIWALCASLMFLDKEFKTLIETLVQDETMPRNKKGLRIKMWLRHKTIGGYFFQAEIQQRLMEDEFKVFRKAKFGQIYSLFSIVIRQSNKNEGQN